MLMSREETLFMYSTCHPCVYYMLALIKSDLKVEGTSHTAADLEAPRSNKRTFHTAIELDTWR
jgi:hypothetical protein